MHVLRHNLTAEEIEAIAAIAAAMPPISPDARLDLNSRADCPIWARQAAPNEIDYGISPAKSLGEKFERLHDVCRCMREAVETRSLATIISRVPVEPNAAPSALLLASLVGGVREFVGHGSPIVDVSDKGLHVGNRPSSDNDLAFSPHTDMSFYPRPPPIIGFLMVQPSARGGESLFCDPAAFVSKLGSSIGELQRPFRFPAPPHQSALPAQTYPILEPDAPGVYSVRYRRDGLEGDREQTVALAQWQDAIEANTLMVPLQAGDFAVYSNKYLLHGRLGFRDSDRTGGRKALRVYIAPSTGGRYSVID